MAIAVHVRTSNLRVPVKDSQTLTVTLEKKCYRHSLRAHGNPYKKQPCLRFPLVVLSPNDINWIVYLLTSMSDNWYIMYYSTPQAEQIIHNFGSDKFNDVIN